MWKTVKKPMRVRDLEAGLAFTKTGKQGFSREIY